MRFADINKTLAIVLVTITVAVLAFYGKINEQAVTGLLGAMIGYVLGNGTGVLERVLRGKDGTINGVKKPPE